MSQITSSFNSAWQQVLEYCKKSPWKERFVDHCMNYLELYCEIMNMSKEEFTRKVQGFHGDLEGKLFGVNIETFIEREYENPEDNVAFEYLKRRKWKMSQESAVCLEEMKDRSFTIYEVVDTKPGEYMVVKDILLDTKEVKVFEGSGSRTAKPFDHLVSKVIQVNGECYFTGTVFKPGYQFVELIKKRIKKELKKKNLSFKQYDIVPKELCLVANDVLRKYTHDLFSESVRYLLTPTTILNPNGEEISINSLNFIIKDKDKVIEKLNNISELERDDEDKLFWAFTEPRKKQKAGGSGTIIDSSDNNIFLGDIEIKDNKLLCNTMTKPAAERLLKIIQDSLGELVSMPVIEHEDLYSQEKTQNNTPAQISSDDIPDEEKQQILEQYFDQHLRKSLDEKIPVLNNKTPRQCAKTDPERVIKWLEMMEENAKENIPDGIYDMSWVYKELGL